MSGTPLISVIVAVYNIREYLAQCVDSLVSQSYNELEILLVDDGSTDGSGALCDEWAARDGRVKALHRPNGGLSAARNTGLENASGEYVAFVDGDDRVDREMYRCLMETALEFSADVVMSGIVAQEQTGRSYEVFKNSFCERQTIDKGTVMSLLVSEREISTSACNKLFKRRLFEHIRFPEGRIYEDKAVMHEVLHSCETIAIDKRAIYYYQLRQNSISKALFSEKNFDQLEAARRRYEFYRQHYPALAEEVLANLCEEAMIQTMIAVKGRAGRAQLRRLGEWVKLGRTAFWKSRRTPWTEKLKTLGKYYLFRAAAAAGRKSRA